MRRTQAHPADLTGFTLVELVVVVMVLGILTAVAMPRLFGMSSTAVDNGVKHSLGVVRSAIDRHAAENGGELPGADGNESTFKSDLAPYLRNAVPVCPVGPAQNDLVDIANGAGTPVGAVNPSEGWRYYYKTGTFIVNYKRPTKSDPSVNYDEL